MSSPPTFPDRFNGSPPCLDRGRLHDHWKGFATPGAVATVLGLLALAFTVSVTTASVLPIGRFMIVAGVTIGFRLARIPA